MAREVILKVSLDDSWDEYDNINKELFAEDLIPSEFRKEGVKAIQIISSVDSAGSACKDNAYSFVNRDAVKMNNGDTMVDVSTAYMAIDYARNEENERIKNAAIEAFKQTYGEIVGDEIADNYPDLQEFIAKLTTQK